MTITNGYATREELLHELFSGEDSAVPDSVDDAVIDDIITDASRAVDDYCDRQFFASTDTLVLTPPVPYDFRLWFGADVLAVQSVTNGDGASVASTEYFLWPRNANSFAALELKQSSTTFWTSGSTADGTISIAASVGYVDRAGSTPAAVAIVRNTHRAALMRAVINYRQRRPSTVYEKMYQDSDWQALVEGYVRHAY